MEQFFGGHTIDSGGIHMAARRAANAGMRALQIFTAIPKYYNDRVSIRPERVHRFPLDVQRDVEVRFGHWSERERWRVRHRATRGSCAGRCGRRTDG